MDNGANSYRRFLDGDDDGFVEVIKTYSDGLILYLNGITSNIHVAEEAADETFYKLLIKKPRYNGKACFKTWLYSIGRNTAYDVLRKTGRHGEVSLDECYDMIKDEEGLERSYIKEERKIALHKALVKLKPEHRQVLWLLYFDSFSAKEAAVIMSKSVHAVESLASRARAALKIILESEDYDYEKL